MASVRESIFFMLLGAALVLLLLPCGYFLMAVPLSSMAAEYRSKAHPRCNVSCVDETCGSNATEQCAALDKLPRTGHADIPLTQHKYIKETVFGGLDGLLTMTAVVLGGIGADLDVRTIFAMGISNLVADAFSMGFGEFVAASAEYDFALNQENEEYREVRELPDEEISEMVATYMKRGLSETDAHRVASIFSKYEDYWVKHMLWEELGLQTPSDLNAPAVSGALMFFSFAGFGMIPLLGIALPMLLHKHFGADWYRPQYSSTVSLVITASTLCLMGAFISIVTGSQSIIRSAALMLLNGCAASGISFALSQGVFSAAEPFVSSPCFSEKRGKKVDMSVPGNDPGAGRLSKTASTAWPLFRRRFMRGLCLLWLTLSALVVAYELMQRMVYESLRVFAYGLLTCVTTGLGVVPLLLVPHTSVNETWLAGANTLAAGMMLAASAGMLREAHDVSGPWAWQVLAGVACGVVFIKASRLMLGDDDDAGVEALCGAVMEKRHFKRAVLIFTVMFCHSAAEGVAVGVAFDRHCEAHFGFFVSLLLAIQNIPEGTAVALVLVPRGVSVALATLIAILTSVPQPLMAVAAFRFVETFQSLLPIGLAFAAGAMIYVSSCDLLVEASEALGKRRLLGIVSTSFVAMLVVQSMLERAAGR